MVVSGGPPPLVTTLELRPVSLSATVKFLCSYGGRIVPRHADASLLYVGGVTRLLSVTLSLSFPELLVKMGELCGVAVFLRCQLPMEDLDALVSITCDDDLANLIVEYDRAAVPKIRAFLSLPKLAKPTSRPSSLASSSSSGSSSSSRGTTVNSLPSPLFARPAAADRCLPQFMARRPRVINVSISVLGKGCREDAESPSSCLPSSCLWLGLVSELSNAFSAQEMEWVSPGNSSSDFGIQHLQISGRLTTTCSLYYMMFRLGDTCLLAFLIFHG